MSTVLLAFYMNPEINQIKTNENESPKLKTSKTNSPLFKAAMSSEKLTFAVAIATLRAFLTRLHHHAHRRQWTELIDRSAISRPESLTEAFSRIRKNAYYFSVNYLIVLAVVIATSLLSRPYSLILIASLAGAWLFLYVLRPTEEEPLLIFGRKYTEREILIALVAATVTVLLLTSVVSLIASAVTVGVGIVCAHGAFRVPEDLFLEQQEPWPWTFGLFPFVETGSTSLV